MQNFRLKMLAATAVAGATALVGGPAVAAPGGAASYTCTGGSVPSGTYKSITVVGVCSVESGATIEVNGNIEVRAGAVFDAQSAPATISVGRNVTGGPGSVVGLGCQPPSMTGNSAHECAADPAGHSDVTVAGNVALDAPAVVMLNGISVGRNVAISGGGSDAPWSVKNNQIDGNVTVTGVTTEWLGILFNKIGGNVTLSDITITDQDGGLMRTFVVRNAIGRNITCTGLAQGISGYGNQIGHRAVGQCAPLAG